MGSLKARLQAGQVQRGLWLGLGCPASTEIASTAGFDWCLIDGEHGPYDISAIAAQARVLGPEACVRIPQAETWMIKQVLDLGLHTVVVPMVDTAEQAHEMACAMRYPSKAFPNGTRGIGASLVRASGYNHDKDYMMQANDRVCLMVQAESVTALENLDAICAVNGVDGVFIGPADLAASMGYLHDLDAPEVQAAIDDALRRIVASGKIAGALSFDADRAAHYVDLGARMVAVASDIALLSTALRDCAKRFTPEP
ncbi:HpcH/HpaI aldolase family protein [Litoreibacter arenae]|uniref:2,4-dihydroxyhept-2-ene-1,7-dioic acid aldolase n=1 Tax=Litoreibacter arenae DSM 19593 TaxID=1123360 RepID=S9QBV7_9RHOB|nr:HpcH/HpaI aldolase/citrate lyase family protein [Litoreibacter arenae]EPX78896.1 2,4-dihydroxyhept-2-ene-1,7-dioic acid aldolase [Litoreibacter arenae DSM 19593]